MKDTRSPGQHGIVKRRMRLPLPHFRTRRLQTQKSPFIGDAFGPQSPPGTWLAQSMQVLRGHKTRRFHARVGTEVLHLGSTPRAETMPASPTPPIRTATAGCYRNGATAMCDMCGSLVISTMRGAAETPRRRSGRIRFSRSYLLVQSQQGLP
jgi:hypothetical protein